MMGPFKCPDCGIWWSGFEHRCRVETTTSTTLSMVGTFEPCDVCGMAVGSLERHTEFRSFSGHASCVKRKVDGR